MNRDTISTRELKLYNSLSKKKEVFEALTPPFVGIYVCGPTVYNDAHLGNARPAIVFDVLNRYLTFLGYKVRLVRNITDVGHLLGDNNEGADRISQKATLEKLEPMEIVNLYTKRYQGLMDLLNIKRPEIEPTATGHLVEQIEMVKKILDNGLAYVSNGSVYFDIPKFLTVKDNNYGQLSGRVVDELLSQTRDLDGQEEKRHPADFALWKNAQPEHLMRWPSPWGMGFPGWHLECTVMSTKYLGETFDIHGGGMDLQFPHHECEIAQAKAVNGKSPVKYWLHNNMITVNGTKMSKSLGNFITIEEAFNGQNALLSQAYSPMTVRFFILQAHYRSTLDFSDEALKAAQKAYNKLMNGLRIIKKLEYKTDTSTLLDNKIEQQIELWIENTYKALDDDLNTALAIGQLFNLLKKINQFYTNPETIAQINESLFQSLKKFFVEMIEQILGLKEEQDLNNVIFIEGLLELYQSAKQNKEYDKVDKIRSYFKSNHLLIKDMKHLIDWGYEE